MRAAFVVYGSLEGRSGGYLYDRELVKGLSRLGVEVEVLPQRFGSFGRRLLGNLDLELCTRLRQSGFDCVLEDEWNHPSLLLPNRLIEGVPIARVALVHNLSTWPKAMPRPDRGPRRVARAIEQAYLRSVDAWLTNSACTESLIFEFMGSTRRPSRVAWPGRDHIPRPAFIERPARAVRRFIAVGHIGPLKGYDALVAGLARLHQTDFELSIVGALDRDVACVRRLRNQIAALGLEARVRFLGEKSHAELAELYAEHDAFISTAPFEGFGIACLEAMGHGLPVIVARSGGSTDFVRDGEEGLLVDAWDPESVDKAMRALMRDSALSHRLAAAARRRFLAHSTWARTAEIALDLLEEAIRIRRKRGR